MGFAVGEIGSNCSWVASPEQGLPESRSDLIPRSRMDSANGMEIEQENLERSGFSKEIVNIMIQAICPATRFIYNYTWLPF